MSEMTKKTAIKKISNKIKNIVELVVIYILIEVFFFCKRSNMPSA